MQLELSAALAHGYTSAAQRARLITEHWGGESLYCPNCTSPTLNSTARNTKAIDYVCPDCNSPFQLKSQSHRFGRKIIDSAYSAMCEAIASNRAPNIVALHYDATRWMVIDVILIPRFVFSLSCIEKRKPLSANARRSGWVGCNILLCNIPEDARIRVVHAGRPIEPHIVRQQFQRLRPLERLPHEQRGWTLDVLNVVRKLGKAEFTLSEIYEHAPELEELHPNNHHVRDKIRQQLQRLRDLDVISFLGAGCYRLVQ